MADLIDRQAAIDALADYIHNVDKVIGTGKLSKADCRDAAESVLEDLPSAQPTLYGYKIEHLAMIARVMEKDGVSPEKVTECFADIVTVVKMIMNEQKEIIKKAVEQWLI